MGLKTGKGGVKDSLRELYEEAFAVHDNHEACFESLGVAPQHAVICLDGNVLMRQIPVIVDREATEHLPERSENATLADVVEIVTKRLLAFFRAASIVIVTFDEPQTLTLAKQDEQRKRDGADKEVSASADFKVNTDKYTLRDMKKAPCLHDLTKGRQARPRYSDEVFRQVKENLGAFLRRSEKTLVVDGADVRGALRHIGSLRVPCISGAGRDAAAVAHWLSHYNHSGEGDLKPVRVARRPHQDNGCASRHRRRCQEPADRVGEAVQPRESVATRGTTRRRRGQQRDGPLGCECRRL